MNEKIPVIFLAGGFGTRLKSVTGDLPKALADINGQPFITLLIKKWIEFGYKNFIFSLHYKSDEIIKEIKKMNFSNCTFRFVTEKEPLGTGGAIKFTISKLNLKNRIIITNADTWISSNLNLFANCSKDSIGIIEVDNCSRYGEIEINKENIITEFKEKNQNLSKGYINIGVYNLSCEHFKNTESVKFSLETELFPSLLQNKSLYAEKLNSKFIDIGIPKDYLNFVINHNELY